MDQLSARSQGKQDIIVSTSGKAMEVLVLALEVVRRRDQTFADIEVERAALRRKAECQMPQTTIYLDNRVFGRERKGQYPLSDH